MAFEVVVLGASGTFPTDSAAATGFLLRSGEAAVWVDAGSGTFRNLQRYVDFFDLEAVVVSHLHIDHYLDLYPLYYGLRYSIRSQGPTGLPVYGPRAAETHLSQLLSNGSQGHCDFSGYLKFHEVAGPGSVTIGPFQVDFSNAVHPIETFAMRIEVEGRSLFYTADTGPSAELTAAAEGTNLLIAEATLQDPDPVLECVHMTAEEAGEMAAESRAGRLLLTHIQPGLDPEASVKLAAKHYPGEILVAGEHLRLEV